MRKTMLLLAALAFSAGVACKAGPTSPTEVWKPNTGPRATIAWELWIGDPRCILGCSSPPPQRLSAGGAGEYEIVSRIRTNHLFKYRVNYPQEAGHRIKTTVWTDARYEFEFSGRPDIRTHEDQSGRLLGLESSFNMTTRSQPGVYFIRVMIEETLPSGAVETLFAEIKLRLE